MFQSRIWGSRYVPGAAVVGDDQAVALERAQDHQSLAVVAGQVEACSSGAGAGPSAGAPDRNCSTRSGWLGGYSPAEWPGPSLAARGRSALSGPPCSEPAAGRSAGPRRPRRSSLRGAACLSAGRTQRRSRRPNSMPSSEPRRAHKACMCPPAGQARAGRLLRLRPRPGRLAVSGMGPDLILRRIR